MEEPGVSCPAPLVTNSITVSLTTLNALECQNKLTRVTDSCRSTFGECIIAEMENYSFKVL